MLSETIETHSRSPEPGPDGPERGGGGYMDVQAVGACSGGSSQVACLVGVSLPRTAQEQQKRPRPKSRALVEPPIGIEPMTCSLRVNRSDRLS